MDVQVSSVNSQFTELAHSRTLFDMKCLLCHDWLFCCCCFSLCYNREGWIIQNGLNHMKNSLKSCFSAGMS